MENIPKSIEWSSTEKKETLFNKDFSNHFLFFYWLWMTMQTVGKTNKYYLKYCFILWNIYTPVRRIVEIDLLTNAPTFMCVYIFMIKTIVSKQLVCSLSFERIFAYSYILNVFGTPFYKPTIDLNKYKHCILSFILWSW